MISNSLNISNYKYDNRNNAIIKVLLYLFFICEAFMLYVVIFEKTLIVLIVMLLIGVILIVFKPHYGLFLSIVAAYSGVASSVLQGLYMPLILLTTVAWILYFFINRINSFVKAPQNTLFLLLGVIMLFSSFYASDKINSYLSIYAFIKYLLLFFLTINILDSWKSIRSLMWILTITGLLMSFYGIYASFFSSTNEPVFRMISFIEDPNSFAIKLIPLVAFSYILIKTEDLIVLRIISFILFISIIFAIILTFSRGGILALFSVLFLIGFKEIKHKRNIFVIAFLIFVMLLIIPKELFLYRLESISNINLDVSIIQRLKILKGGLNMFFDNPLLGVGTGNFIVHSKIYCNTIYSRVAHNSFLHVAAETGIIGLFVYLSILTITFKNLINCCKFLKNTKNYYYSLGVIYAFLGFMVHSLFLSEQYNVLLFILIALSIVMNNIISLTKS